MDTAGQLQGQPFTQQQLPDPCPFPSFLHPRVQFHNGRTSPCQQSQQHASSAPCQGCYSHCIPWAPGKKGLTAEPSALQGSLC